MIGWYLVLNGVPLNAIININEIVNKLFLARDKFIPEMHIKQPGFTYSACGAFTKNKEWIQKFKETGDKKIYLHKWIR